MFSKYELDTLKKALVLLILEHEEDSEKKKKYRKIIEKIDDLQLERKVFLRLDKRGDTNGI